jgi:hypothetical protein
MATKALYCYEVDAKAHLRTFPQATVLAALRSAADGNVHTITTKTRRNGLAYSGGMISETRIQATIRASGTATRTFNFTGLCGSYLADGKRFGRLDSACAHAFTRAQATKSLRTVVCLDRSKQRIASVEIEAF